MFGNNMTSAPVPAGYRPTHRQQPHVAVYFLEELKGKVFWEAMDPNCCHFLHQVLERRKPEGVQLIFSEVKDQICVLMLDRFGSYVIEKLYDVCDEEQMNQLVFSVTANVDLLMAVCLNSQGSKSMKKFLECLMTPEQISHMISIFQRFTVPLVNHEIGVEVIRHCFDIFPAKQTQIIDVIAGNLFEIATKEIGSFLLRDVLKSKVFLIESRQRILSEIIANVHSLSRDPAGRNVVGCVIDFRMQDGVRDIVARLTGAFACMSVTKYATDVVLKLIENYKEEYAPQIIDEIICSSDFSRVLQHPDGQNVLEHAKKYSTGTVLKSLNHKIALHSDHLHSHHNILPKSQGTVHKILNPKIVLHSDHLHSHNNILPKSQGTVHKILNHQIPLHSDHLHSHCHGKNILPISQGTVRKILNHQIPLHSDRLRSDCRGKNTKPIWKR